MSDATWEEALTTSGLSASAPVVQRVWSARRSEFPVFPLYEFVAEVPEQDLPTVFRLFVYLFGTAEGRVYREEAVEHCNHWGTATRLTTGWCAIC